MLNTLIEKALSIPLLFELQQKYFNDYNSVYEEFKSYLNVKGKKILEIGCSTGICARKIINMVDNEYFGIDISDKYIEIAKNHSSHGNFICMNAAKMTFEDESFDIILFNGVLHHMDNNLIANCLKEVKRTLKQDGVVIIGEPVFSANKPLSNLLLSFDRGKYIRSQESYAKLMVDFKVKYTGFFKLSYHQFCSFVLSKE
jgi:ubiquinone/menaquinone biosynthesis C-methylase UbiE